MQCATRGCEYPCELYKGKVRTSCCHKCRYTRGREHNDYCIAYTSRSHRRSRSSAPSPSSSSRSRSQEHRYRACQAALATEHAKQPLVLECNHRHCFVITLGLRGHFGMQLFEHNPELRSNAIDARSLRDPSADQRGGPWGTCIATQQRLLQHSQCEPLVREVIRRILSEARVVVFCEHGHHRSVGVAEIAVQEIKLFRVVRIDITTIHIDAKQCTSQQWEDLWNRRI